MENTQSSVSNKKIANSLFWKMFERLSVQGINLLVQIILARILMPDDFGNLALIVAVTNYAGIFVQTGFATAIIQKKDIDDLDISTLLTTSIGIAAVLYAVLFVLAPYISGIYNTTVLVWPLRVLGLLLFLNAVNSIQTAILSRKMKFKKIFLRSIIAVPISGAIGIILALENFGLWALVIHNVVNTLIIIIVMMFEKDCRIRLRFSFGKLKAILPFSVKILLTGCVTGGSDFIRTMMIGKKYSPEDLAYYDKAYTYSNYVTQIVGQSITSVMLPSLSRIQDDAARLKQLARRSIQTSTFIIFPILLGVAAVSKPFVLILLTEKWAPAIPFLSLFCVLRMPAFISNIDKQVYYALGRSGINLGYEIILLTLNVVALLISVRLGVFYIAIGATVVEWLGCVALSLVSRKLYGYTIAERLSDVWRPIFNSALMAALVYLIGFLGLDLYITLVLQVVSGIAIYTIMAYITGDKVFKDFFAKALSVIKKTVGKKHPDKKEDKQ